MSEAFPQLFVLDDVVTRSRHRQTKKFSRRRAGQGAGRLQGRRGTDVSDRRALREALDGTVPPSPYISIAGNRVTNGRY
jgi:hypothetical protein